jgi:hypothetical protein
MIHIPVQQVEAKDSLFRQTHTLKDKTAPSYNASDLIQFKREPLLKIKYSSKPIKQPRKKSPVELLKQLVRIAANHYALTF